MEDPEWRWKIGKAHEEKAWKIARRLEEVDEQRRKVARVEDPPAAAVPEQQPSTSSSSNSSPPPKASEDAAMVPPVEHQDTEGERSSKRQRIQFLDTAGLDMRDKNDRERVWRAIGGGVSTILTVGDEPMSREDDAGKEIAAKCYAKMNEDMAKSGGKFVHIHREPRAGTRRITQTYSHRMNNGSYFTTNSEKLIKKAGRIDNKDMKRKLTDEEIMGEIKKFVMEQREPHVENYDITGDAKRC